MGIDAEEGVAAAGALQSHDEGADGFVEVCEMEIFEYTDNFAFVAPDFEGLADGVLVFKHGGGFLVDEIIHGVGRIVAGEVAACAEGEAHCPYKIITGGGDGELGV